MNSRDELDVEGSYYAKLIGQARVDGRIGKVPHDPNAMVYTFCDVGFTDSTAIWFVQFIQKELHVIDLYENNGEPIEHYVRYIHSKPYAYAENSHWAPPDIEGKQLNIGKSSWDVARELGLTFQIVQRHEVQYGIDEARSIIPQCWFDEDKCFRGLEALEHFQRQKNKVLSTDEKPVFSKTPLADWAIHAADGFRYFAVAYRCDLVMDGIRIGSTNPELAVEYEHGREEYHALRHRCGGRA